MEFYMRLFNNCTTIYIYGALYNYLLIKLMIFLVNRFIHHKLNFITKVTKAGNWE